MTDRGKVIRVPAEINLKCRQQTIPYIVGADEKVKETVAKMRQMFLGEDETDSKERMDFYERRKLLWGFWFLEGTSSIEQILSGEEDFLKEKFSNAKFIARLYDLKSDTHNYYYIAEDLPEDWSVADVIACFANAQSIQEYLEKLLPKCSFEGCATLNCDDALPIAKIPKSKARYVAAHQDDLYVVCDGREISRINKALADLMISEIENSNASQIHLVRSVGNVRELFSVEHPELAEFLSKVSMIKKLDIQDEDNEFFYIVSDIAGLDVVDMIVHQVAISRIPSLPSMESSTCKCSNCPYVIDDINRTELILNYRSLHSIKSINEKQSVLPKLDSISSGDKDISNVDDKDILEVLKIFKGSSVADFCKELLADENSAEAVKTSIVNSMRQEQDLKININIQSSCKMTITFVKTDDDKTPLKYPLKYPRHESGDKINSKMNHTPYVLLVMILYKLYKEGSKGSTILPFAISGNISGMYNEQVQYKNPKKQDEYLPRNKYYNKGMAILYGFLYNIFKVDDFDKAETFETWVPSMAEYLGINREGERKYTVINLLNNIDKIVDFEQENANEKLKDNKEMWWVLCRDFIYLVSSISSNDFESESYAALEWNLKIMGLNKSAMLMGEAVMPNFELEVSGEKVWDNKNKNFSTNDVWEKIRYAFFKLFNYMGI